ncbi:hypothetical protein MKX08_010239 [Trichoderma sp. CBMAI-0020]|nr:hypothetical protein MKX08_010239 [Trichoderma sp. CBMAI-0020]
MQRYLAQTPQQDAGTYARLVLVVGHPLKEKQFSPVDCILAQKSNLQLDTPSTEANSSLISPEFSTGCLFIGSSTLSWAYHASSGHFELEVFTHAAHVVGSHLKSSAALYTDQSWQVCSVDFFGADALEQWLHLCNKPLEQSVTSSDPEGWMEQKEQEDEHSSSSSSPPSEEVFSLKSSSNTDTNSASILDDEEAVLHNATAEQASDSDLRPVSQIEETMRAPMLRIKRLTLMKGRAAAGASVGKGGRVPEKIPIVERIQASIKETVEVES